jgi:hypothetical protein
MKVSELIKRLENCDANAEVYIMSQPNWPFEHRISGLATRADWPEEGEEDGAEEDVAEPAIAGPPTKRRFPEATSSCSKEARSATARREGMGQRTLRGLGPRAERSRRAFRPARLQRPLPRRVGRVAPRPENPESLSSWAKTSAFRTISASPSASRKVRIA